MRDRSDRPYGGRLTGQCCPSRHGHRGVGQNPKSTGNEEISCERAPADLDLGFLREVGLEQRFEHHQNVSRAGGRAARWPLPRTAWRCRDTLPHLTPGLAGAVAPYLAAGRVALRLPAGFAQEIPLQILVVALPEELFYRGWMQTSWAWSAPGRGVRVLGVRLGAGFLWTQILFAAGHLVVLQPWRLATFLPGLWFGWLRERHGSIVAPVVAHALSNLFLRALEASFYGR